jgi:hypothetical protein
MKPNQSLKQLQQEIAALENFIKKYESFAKDMRDKNYGDVSPKELTETLAIYERLRDNKIPRIQKKLAKLKEKHTEILAVSQAPSEPSSQADHKLFSKKYRPMRMDEDEAGCQQCCTIL